MKKRNKDACHSLNNPEPVREERSCLGAGTAGAPRQELLLKYGRCPAGAGEERSGRRRREHIILLSLWLRGSGTTPSPGEPVPGAAAAAARASEKLICRFCLMRLHKSHLP